MSSAELADVPAAVSPRKRSLMALAAKDVVDGIALWPLWVKLGWNDILQRYRRSLLGPFWLTASMAIMVVALGILYAELFKTDVRSFLPFLCVGLLVWNYFSSTVGEAGSLFTGVESYIKQIRLPYSLYLYRFVWSRMIIFAHNFVIYFGVMIYFEIWPGATALLAIPGFLLVTLNAGLMSLTIGMASARFRDIPQIIGSVIQIAFFMTPVMWTPELVGQRTYIVEFNPFYHMLEIVRAPLLGNVPATHSYLVVVGVTLVSFVIAAMCFVRFRSRIAYWV
jgi:ABC-2 type transport system permease protein/lipopolysaccharide transport system permease protein